MLFLVLFEIVGSFTGANGNGQRVLDRGKLIRRRSLYERCVDSCEKEIKRATSAGRCDRATETGDGNKSWKSRKPRLARRYSRGIGGASRNS